MNIRKFIVRATHLDELVELGTLTPAAAAFLEAATVSGLNIIVAGGTQAGKTTLLNCLAGSVPARERVVTCEEVFELRIPLPDTVALQCRQANLEGQVRFDCVASSRRRFGCGRRASSSGRCARRSVSTC
ncbi:MAG TPA: ATPase, T2SS/T4P/T4SS family [Jiangellaceae bacterium]